MGFCTFLIASVIYNATTKGKSPESKRRAIMDEVITLKSGKQITKYEYFRKFPSWYDAYSPLSLVKQWIYHYPDGKERENAINIAIDFINKGADTDDPEVISEMGDIWERKRNE